MTVERYRPDELTHEIRLAVGSKAARIWSGEHGAYWRPNASGYTQRADEAGIYTVGQAWRLTNHCGPEKRIEIEVIQ